MGGLNVWFRCQRCSGETGLFNEQGIAAMFFDKVSYFLVSSYQFR